MSTDIEKLSQGTRVLKRLCTLLKLSLLNPTILHCFVDPHYVAFTVCNIHFDITYDQNIDFANVQISNCCAYGVRLPCTFVNDTLLNLPTPFNIIPALMPSGILFGQEH